LERLRYIREQAGYSQQDLADKSGVSQHTISELELGRRKAQGRTLRKLAKVLDVQVADLYEEPDHPLAEAPPSTQLTLNGLLAEERGLDATVRESEHIKGYVNGCLARWARVAQGEDPHLAPDHAYSIEVYQHVIALTEWFGNLLRVIKAELPPEVAVAEQREIIGLIDRMGTLSAEIAAVADAAEGIPAEAMDEKVQALINAEVKAVIAERKPADELAQLRAELSRRNYEARSEVQRSAAKVKRLAAGE
jgi:transcriptional regulator with XRE-family HTH domain